MMTNVLYIITVDLAIFSCVDFLEFVIFMNFSRSLEFANYQFQWEYSAIILLIFEILKFAKKMVFLAK